MSEYILLEMTCVLADSKCEGGNTASVQTPVVCRQNTGKVLSSDNHPAIHSWLACSDEAIKICKSPN